MQELFWEEEAQSIFSIPISMRGALNKLTWGLSVNGSFTVKSAYTSTLSLKSNNEGEASDAAEYSRIWKSIWALKIPEKVKKFLWRLSTNIVSINSNLFRKNLVGTVNCPIYVHEGETWIHMVWNCIASSDV